MNGAEVIATIESEGLSSFCLSILDDADELTRIFDEITDKVNELKDCLTSEALNQIYREYEEIERNYITIHENIVSYSDDFIAVKNIIESGMKDITIKFENETEEFLKKSKEVE